MKLSSLQRKHFEAMSAAELSAAIADSEKQLRVIRFSPTEGGAKKRAELQARIDFCVKLKATQKKPARKQTIVATPRKTDKGWLVVFACGHWRFLKNKPRNPKVGLCGQC